MTSLTHAIRQSKILGVIIAFLVITLALVVVVGAKEITDTHKQATDTNRLAAEQKRQTDCVAKWANDYAARADRISSLNTSRANKLDDLIRAISTQSKRAEAAAYAAYLKASNDYLTGLKADPLPASPKFLCNVGPKGSAAGVITTKTVTATPPPQPTPAPVTRTRTAPGASSTATRVLPGQGSTVTRTATVAGRTHTVTTTRTTTVTRTRTVPVLPPVTLPCIPILCRGAQRAV